MPELLEVLGGWLYYGEVRLNCKRIGNCIRFPVKEQWLRPICGETVDIPISEFVELINQGAEQEST